MNVVDAILARGESNAPALLQGGRVVTYGSLREHARRVALSLLERGHVKGDRIGLLSENSPFFVAAYLGIIRAGCVAVPFQTDLSPVTFARIVSDAGITAVLVSDRSHRVLQSWPECAKVALVRDADLAPAPGDLGATLPTVKPDTDLAALMFTSGSTGAPKGVMVTHRNIETNSLDIIGYLGLAARDRVMVVLPFHYCFGASLLHTHLWAGGSLVLNNSFKLFPEAVLLEMQENGCTGLAGVPSTYQMLLRKSRFCSLQFPRLRWFQQAGGKLPNAQIGEILQAFPKVQYFLMYGQTEATARLSYLPPERLADKLGSIGRGLPSTRLEVLKPDGVPVTPGSAETGEIVASGANVALGYWNDPAETVKYFRGGKLYTGDIARVDAEGFIYVVEREREMIKSGGNRVSAKEVEEAIAELPEVVEVAVLGWPHELLGESIKAFIVPVPGCRLEVQKVREHCRKRLQSFKVPEQIVLLEHMPHNSSGKIVKATLREMLTSTSANSLAASTVTSNVE